MDSLRQKLNEMKLPTEKSGQGKAATLGRLVSFKKSKRYKRLKSAMTTRKSSSRKQDVSQRQGMSSDFLKTTIPTWRERGHMIRLQKKYGSTKEDMSEITLSALMSKSIERDDDELKFGATVTKAQRSGDLQVKSGGNRGAASTRELIAAYKRRKERIKRKNR